jgi:hypothetical protein
VGKRRKKKKEEKEEKKKNKKKGERVSVEGKSDRDGMRNGSRKPAWKKYRRAVGGYKGESKEEQRVGMKRSKKKEKSRGG